MDRRRGGSVSHVPLSLAVDGERLAQEDRARRVWGVAIKV